MSVCLLAKADDIVVQKQDNAIVPVQNNIVEKPIVVVIPSYNNAQWFQLNLGSVLGQKYSNFRVIYVDDCSTDDTFNLVTNYVNQLGFSHKVWIIRNKTRRGALGNLYSAIHSCKDNEIIVTVDGDDWLYNDRVLARVNQVYADTNVWLTHGHYIAHPDYNPVQIKEITPGVIQKNIYREWDWVTTHLRTFYAGLFKKIKLEDLLYKGVFFDVTWDIAMLMPMLELSGGHFKCIQDVLYVYNCATPSNDFKTKLVNQLHCDKVIRARKKYTPLHEAPYATNKSIDYKASLVLFSSDSPAHLFATLETIERYVCNIRDVHILFQASTPEMNKAYQKVQERFVGLNYHPYAQGMLKIVMRHTLQQSGDFVVLAHDGVIAKDFIDFAECSRFMQATGAVGFYLGLGKNITDNNLLSRKQNQPPMLLIKDDVYAWQFINAEHDWRNPYVCTMTMLKKEELLNEIQDIEFNNLFMLETALKTANRSLESIALCFEESKALFVANFQNRGLDKFNEGSKFDTVELFKMHNSSIILAHAMNYIERGEQ
jgi:hypothetical protein